MASLVTRRRPYDKESPRRIVAIRRILGGRPGAGNRARRLGTVPQSPRGRAGGRSAADRGRRGAGARGRVRDRGGRRSSPPPPSADDVRGPLDSCPRGRSGGRARLAGGRSLLLARAAGAARRGADAPGRRRLVRRRLGRLGRWAVVRPKPRRRGDSALAAAHLPPRPRVSIGKAPRTGRAPRGRGSLRPGPGGGGRESALPRSAARPSLLAELLRQLVPRSRRPRPRADAGPALAVLCRSNRPRVGSRGRPAYSAGDTDRETACSCRSWRRPSCSARPRLRMRPRSCRIRSRIRPGPSLPRSSSSARSGRPASLRAWPGASRAFCAPGRTSRGSQTGWARRRSPGRSANGSRPHLAIPRSRSRTGSRPSSATSTETAGGSRCPKQGDGRSTTAIVRSGQQVAIVVHDASLPERVTARRRDRCDRPPGGRQRAATRRTARATRGSARVAGADRRDRRPGAAEARARLA